MWVMGLLPQVFNWYAMINMFLPIIQHVRRMHVANLLAAKYLKLIFHV